MNAFEKYKTIDKNRLFSHKFIPIEKIAKNPRKYGYLNTEPRESNAKQEAFINSKKKICAVIAGNRTGKTQSGAIKFLKTCLTTPNGRAWVVSPSFDAQKSGVQEKIMYFLKPQDIKSKQYAIGSALKQIELINGTVIEFKTFEQGREKLQSAKLICVWIDEEITSESMWWEIYTRTLDLKAQIILTFTPLNGFSFTYQQVYTSKAENVDVFTWGMYDNPFISIIEIDDMKAKLSPKEAKMRLYGQYAGSETQVYYSFDRQRHVKENIYNHDLPVYVSVDWGVRVTAVGFIQRDKQTINGKVYDLFKNIDGAELCGFGYGQVMQWILSRVGAKGYYIQDYFCDPAGRQRQAASKAGHSLLDKISEEYGIDFGYIKTLGIEESIEVVSSYLMNEYGQVRLIFEKNISLDDKQHGIAERVEGYIRGEDGKPIKDDVNDHYNDMLRYGILNIIKGENKKWVQH